MPTQRLDTEVKTGVVRLVYPHLFEPQAFDDNPANAKYSVMVLIPKSDQDTIQAINQAYENAKQNGIAQYGQGFASKATPLKRPVGSNSGLIRDADEWPDFQDDPNFQDHYIMSIKSTQPPLVMATEAGKRKLEEQEGKELVYSGCYGRVKFSIFPYNKVGTGITCGLLTVIKTKDGDSIGGAHGSINDFDDEFEQSLSNLL